MVLTNQILLKFKILTLYLLKVKSGKTIS